jgi:hypothetical protein
MNYHKEIDLINRLLGLQKKRHPNIKDQMLYERGYLTGLLARLMHEDAGLRTTINKLIKRLEDSSKK